MLKELTKNQFDTLNSDEWVVTNLRYCLSGFKRQTTTKQNDLVFDIYDELSGTKNYRNYGCPNCLFRAWSAVAKAYFAYTPTNDEKPNEDTASEVTEPKKPAKKTVKKKTTKKTAAKKRKTQ